MSDRIEIWTDYRKCKQCGGNYRGKGEFCSPRCENRHDNDEPTSAFVESLKEVQSFSMMCRRDK
jgi:hypothetical protein